jgi:hypothetical protein
MPAFGAGSALTALDPDPVGAAEITPLGSDRLVAKPPSVDTGDGTGSVSDGLAGEEGAMSVAGGFDWAGPASGIGVCACANADSAHPKPMRKPALNRPITPERPGSMHMVSPGARVLPKIARRHSFLKLKEKAKYPRLTAPSTPVSKVAFRSAKGAGGTRK